MAGGISESSGFWQIVFPGKEPATTMKATLKARLAANGSVEKLVNIKPKEYVVLNKTDGIKLCQMIFFQLWEHIENKIHCAAVLKNWDLRNRRTPTSEISKTIQNPDPKSFPEPIQETHLCNCWHCREQENVLQMAHPRTRPSQVRKAVDFFKGKRRLCNKFRQTNWFCNCVVGSALHALHGVKTPINLPTQPLPTRIATGVPKKGTSLGDH